MPPSFLYPRAEDLHAGEVESDGSDLWLPQLMTAEQRASRGFSDNVTIARLAPGASIGTAERELGEFMTRLDRTRDVDMQGWSIALRSLVESSVGEARAPVWTLFGAVTFVLLIACSNVAHLLLTRAGHRAREMAIRSALGASQWQMTRRALGESMALAVCGGLFGVLIAYGAVRILVGINPGNIPRLAEASIDGRVLLFGVALSAFTGLLLGLVPARWAAGAVAGDLLRAQAGHASVAGRRLRSSLVAGEVALAMVLMAGAGLLLRSYAAVQRVEPGFSPSSVTLAVFLDDRYDSPEAQRRVFQSLLAEVRAIPGVNASGIVDALPMSKTQRLSRFEVDGIANEPDQLVHSRMATPGYFDAIGTRLVEGRAFREPDARAPSTVMLVNQTFARRYFPDQQAVGGRVRFRNQDSAAPNRWSTIVGIVADVRHTSVEEAAVPQVYTPWNGMTDRGYLVVSSTLEAAAVIASVRSAARAVDPMLPMDRLASMNDLVDAANARRRFQTSVIAACAFGAWLLAGLGLYGLIVHAVQQRMTEIGIRIALGAQARDVMRLIIGQGISLTAAGLLIGGLAAVLLTRAVQAWLFQVSPGDPVAFGLSGAALLFAALVGSYIPARRATRADVMKVLRAE
jgi:putative ABC transport system permease protein